MAFQKGAYTADNGTTVMKIKLSVEDMTAAASANHVAATITDPMSVKVSGSRRKDGVHPRCVRLERKDTNGLIHYKTLPILTKTDFDSAAYAVGQSLSIANTAWTIISKIPELFV